jgi:hypothetical protein
LACFGEDFPFHFAHRCFMASEMRLRAAGLIRRRFPPVDGAFGGRPRRGAVEVSPSSAEMAWSIRLRSALRPETMFWMSMRPFKCCAQNCSSRALFNLDCDLPVLYRTFTISRENRALCRCAKNQFFDWHQFGKGFRDEFLRDTINSRTRERRFSRAESPSTSHDSA